MAWKVKESRKVNLKRVTEMGYMMEREAWSADKAVKKKKKWATAHIQTHTHPSGFVSNGPYSV